MSLRVISLVGLAALIVIGSIFIWNKNSVSSELRFQNAKSGVIPHTMGKAASARFGRYRWKNVQGWVPYTVPIKGTDFLVFIHDPKVLERAEHVLVAVDTNKGIILESAPFHGLLMGPGMQGTSTSSWEKQGKIHYEETTHGRTFHFEAPIVKTNFVKQSRRSNSP